MMFKITGVKVDGGNETHYFIPAGPGTGTTLNFVTFSFQIFQEFLGCT